MQSRTYFFSLPMNCGSCRTIGSLPGYRDLMKFTRSWKSIIMWKSDSDSAYHISTFHFSTIIKIRGGHLHHHRVPRVSDANQQALFSGVSYDFTTAATHGACCNVHELAGFEAVAGNLKIDVFT